MLILTKFQIECYLMKILAPRTQIKDYLVENIIDNYEDKVTYKVEDFRLDKSALLSEYEISKKEIYEKLLSFKHTNIVSIDKIFEYNQRLYTVSKLSTALKLEKYLLSNSMSESEINKTINSMLDMMFELKQLELSINLKIDNLIITEEKSIVVNNSINMINYINDEQTIYQVGLLAYFLVTKESYESVEELKPNQQYSKSLCGLINRMLGVADNKKFKTLQEPKGLVKQSVRDSEISCEPIVCEDNNSNKISKIFSLMSIILIVVAGSYVLTSEKKVLKASEIGLFQSIQYHLAGYMNKNEAQFALGEMYEKGYAVDIDYKEALYWYEKSANNTNVPAQSYLGYLYKEGKVIQKDINKALYWYEKAANNGSEIAQYSLGYLYYAGVDILKNSRKAIFWLEKAGPQNYKNAYHILGLLYLNSDGDAIDYQKSFKYFSKGLDSNDSYSQMAVAYMYQKGYGVEENHQKAIELYEKAANGGHKVAQYNLGRIYHYGKGVKSDKKKARHWYLLAYNQGYKEAKKALNVLNKKSKVKKKQKIKVQEAKRYDKPVVAQKYKEPQSISYGRFIDRGEFIEDTDTRLFWQKDGKSSGKLNFYQAKEYAKNLNLGGVKGWRVPTAQELESIFPAVEKPFINSFYNAMEYNRGKDRWTSYWTSELDTSMQDYAYVYHWYSNGGKNNCYASKNYVYVRCVHD